jgi:hypothetical protein
MTIRQQGGIFGRNPTFNDVTIDGDLTVEGTVIHTGDLTIDNINISGNTISSTDTNGDIILEPNGSGNVISTNKLLAGTSNALATAVSGDSNSPFVTIEDSLCPTVGLFRNDTSIANNNTFGSIGFYGNDTTSNSPKPLAAVQAISEGTHSTGDNPTALRFLVTADNSDAIAEVARFNNAGNLVFKNAGQGIDFSATAGTGTSELFDDYEEGTWSPTVTSGSGTLTTVTVSEALYTKIGRMVTVHTKFVLTDAGTGSSNLIVDGFPYTINSDYANGVAMGRNVSSANLIFGQVSGGNSKVTLLRNYDNTDPITNGHTYTLTANYSV